MVVFPTPGGPESRAALNPEPSSLPPPNLPNLAAAHQEKEQSEISLNNKLTETKVSPVFSFYFLSTVHTHNLTTRTELNHQIPAGLEAPPL